MKRKKILSVCISFITALCAIPMNETFFPVQKITASAADMTHGALYYKINDEGTITITGYDKDVTSIIIPSTIDGISVTAIANNAFRDYAFGGIVIPDSVTSIGENVFWNANGDDLAIFANTGSYAETYAADKGIPFFAPEELSGDMGDDIHWSFDITSFHLTLNGSGAMPVFEGYSYLTLPCYIAEDNIPWYLFRNAIQSAEVGGTITTIGEEAFFDCYNLKSVTMSDTVIGIEQYAFTDCNHLSELVISDSLEYVDYNGVFTRCNGLTVLNFPKTMKSLPAADMFYECENISAINVAEGNSTYCSKDGVLYSADMSILHFYPFAKTDKYYEIPNSVTKISSGAFEYAKALEQISLPDSLTYIGSQAFAFTGIKSVIIPESVSYIGSYAFYAEKLTAVVFKGAAPQNGGSLFYSKGTAFTDAYCHFSYDGWSELMAEYTENVNWLDLDAYSDDSITLSETKVSMKERESYRITAMMSPAVSLSTVWSSSDSDIARVSNGVITGISAGKCTITASDESGRYSASCEVTVISNPIAEESPVVVQGSGAISSNESGNNYSVWAKSVNSYLNETNDDLLERVEYIDGVVYVETYKKSDGSLVKALELECELSDFGGFFSGEDYNFLVFGQTNSSFSSTAEVLRVVKYSKEWKRLDSLSIASGDVYIPFDASSCRMAESKDNLYIHAGQELTNGHQSNMTFKINKKDMSLIESMTFITTISTLSNFEQEGFVSHSFNQFVAEEDGFIYRVDHGEGAMHGIGISKCADNGNISDVTTLIAYPFHKGNGTNYTGASVGGIALGVDNVLIAANSMDQTSEEYPWGHRNIMISVVSKNLKSAETVWLTDYAESDSISVRTPQITAFESEQFLVMWEESVSGNKFTKAVTIDGDGNMTSEIVTISYPLSDCQPVCNSDGFVRWYSTNNSSPVIYAIDPYEIEKYAVSNIEGDVNGDGTFSIADAVMLQKYLLNIGVLINRDAGDLCKDNRINIFDLARMKEILCS